ncbi:MFS transporter [Nocardioides sp.]|uniref:MFS transporter n=1 Tax=Nocardioides sp. TaxID=35761 RepID=UPI00262A3FD6|nr:MFS transporter [Nocardioides sp.]MDI6909674.1 MFS transporter [Nocardioides sp.]
MPAVLPARNAVAVVFILNGFCFASFVSRVPDIRSTLDLSNGRLGLLLLAISAGSVLALPSAGRLIQRVGPAGAVRLGAASCAVGLTLATVAIGVWETMPAAAVGLFLYGVGTGVWDVAMNVDGAAVERHLGRTVMPRFHAGFSFGTIAGSALGVPMAAGHVPLEVHVTAVVLLSFGAVLVAARYFLPPPPEEVVAAPARSAWLEPRTLAIGVMVLAFALTEGSANDWLALALVDGYDTEHWVGVAGFSLFVTAMTAGRLVGSTALDRFGRAPVLWASSATALTGVLLVVYGHWAPLVVVGILLWGLGASLGFPVGMSVAADDPVRAAARVSVVSTIGYAAFLTGPPFLGWLGDHVGTLHSLLTIAVLMGPAAVAVLATRQPARREQPA